MGAFVSSLVVHAEERQRNPDEHEASELRRREVLVEDQRAEKRELLNGQPEIASLPDIPGAKDKRVDVNAYNIGGYSGPVSIDVTLLTSAPTAR